MRDEAAAAGTLVWDPYDPAWVEDPYAVYAELRRSNPVHRNALGFWVFTRHADCLAILRDRRSSSDGRNVDASLLSRAAGRRPSAATGPRGRCWPRWRRSCSATRPTTPACAGSCRRRSRPGWSRDCGRGSRRSATGCSTRRSSAVRSTSWPTTPTRCPCRSSWRCWGCPPRTTSSSGCGPTRWRGGSIPTSSCPPRRCSSGWGRSCRSCSTSPRSSRSGARRPATTSSPG